ncbi:MAG: hypothetical protein U1E45_06475 [Geminicoccaceae bacterium]
MPISKLIDFDGLQAQVYDPNGIWRTGVATLKLSGVVGITASDFA